MGLRSYGKYPSSQEMEKFKNSQQYNQSTKEFDNRLSRIHYTGLKRITLWDYCRIYFETFGEHSPKTKLPEQKLDLKKFLIKNNDFKVIWLGHSSLLINSHGTKILIDPVFSQSASPFNFIARRFQSPVINLKDLPEIDYILISHDHFDHLDMETVKNFKNKNTRFIAPLGISSYLTNWGIKKDLITELDWWQSHQVQDHQFIATPAQHCSGRRPLSQIKLSGLMGY